jgi:hypothetical protein
MTVDYYEEEIIVIKYPGRCRLCGDNFPVGSQVLWSPVFGIRCIESEEVGGEDQCIGRFFNSENYP